MKTPNIKIIFIISIIFSSCNHKPSNFEKLCLEINNTPQVEFPDRQDDKKIKLIRQLKNYKSDEVYDTLKSIFLSVDTTIRGYWEYKDAALNTLSEINTENSLKVLSEIIKDHPIGVESNMFYLWELKSRTDSIRKMFPNLTHSLGKQKYTDGDILRMIAKAYQKRQIKREQLEASRNDLIEFYNYLKIEKYSLPGSKHDERYYDFLLPDLLKCLRIFETDQKINAIYRDVLKINSDFGKCCEVSNSEYYGKSKLKIEALFQAIIGLIQNNQEVEEKYIEMVAAEPLYHNDFYQEFVKLNKQSLFPESQLSKESFALSDLSICKEKSLDDILPYCLEYIGKSEIHKGKNQGVYYFYNAKWHDKEKINIEVSGPQPLGQNEFLLKSEWTYKIHAYSLTKNQVTTEIDKIIKKLKE